MVAKDIIVKNSTWTIGNGKRVHIWEDRWLPTSESFIVVSSRGSHTEVEMVPSLINMERRGWNVAIVKNIFLPDEVDVILGIPISSRLPDDSLIWAWTPNGKFNVRSANQVAQKYGERRNQQGERKGCLDGLRMKAIWKMI